MRRRNFLQLLAADAVALPHLHQIARAAAPYQVGVGYAPNDPYGATGRALAASGQFPAVAGKTVVIKPNLVSPKPANTGVTTDPQVTRAVVDQALAAGAAQILIVEGGAGLPPANFAACGYAFFSSYDPRVQLMDLATQPSTLVPVPNGLAYFAMHLPTPVVQPGLVFITIGKLKTHTNTVASLSVKNVYGLAVPTYYLVPNQLARMDGHLRGIDQSAVDINLARPTSFALIDGIWGMQGAGPLYGTPIQTGVVFAGLNAVAVDRVALDFMKIPQTHVPLLTYASLRGLGPADTSSVTVSGDPFTPIAFQLASNPPIVWRPSAYPNPISSGAGQKTAITFNLAAPCPVAARIVQDNDATPGMTVVRNLQSWTAAPAGNSTLTWDGRNDQGAKVAPGVYLANILARTASDIRYASNWILVNP